MRRSLIQAKQLKYWALLVNINYLVKIGEFEPVKEMPRDRLFIKEDIFNFQKYRKG